MLRVAVTITWLLGSVPAGAQIALTQGTNFSLDVSPNGRVAFDLMNTIWIMPPTGGMATAISGSESAARRPRWSPDAAQVLYQVRKDGQDQLWLYRMGDAARENLSGEGFYDRHPDWHPDGERIVFASDRRDTGFDLWELDLATRLTWRITSLPGDESEPQWSASGRDLVYVHENAGEWSIVLRRHGQSEQVLEKSSTRLSSPSWRPDGSLITFLRHGDDGYTIEMIILSDPLLIRPIIAGEDIFVGAVAWRNRQQLLYTSNGLIRTRAFNSWTSRTLPFRAVLLSRDSHEAEAPPQRRLPAADEPSGTLVIRAARLFDGVDDHYRIGQDIVIEGGRIAAIEDRRDRDGAIMVDLGDVTVTPGLIDSNAWLPGESGPRLGPLLLSYGVTAIAAEHPRGKDLDKLWSGKEMPGPRILPGDWAPGLDELSSLAINADTLPVSPAGIRYENVQIASSAKPAMLLSDLADARTPGIQDLLKSRQAALVTHYQATIRHFTDQPQLSTQSPAIVLGSRGNGFPPGIAQHAELRALEAAGLSPLRAIRSAGINAAMALGLGLSIGRIAPGAAADLVIVDGDPLNRVRDLQNVVGIVRNGRFYSAISLIERASQAGNVE